jgi:sugar lactone lactonase YvrE
MGRITPDGQMTLFPLPASAGVPGLLAEGADGNLWFTSSQTDSIGRMTPDGTVTEFPVHNGPSDMCPPAFEGLTAGPDGNVWFTDLVANEVGRITPSGNVTLFPVSHTPLMITVGPDGNLWFTQVVGAGLGRITPSGQVSEFPMDSGYPSGITAGPDGAIWVADGLGAIDRVTTDGAVTQYAVPWANSAPGFITTGPDGNIWFTDQGNCAIGEVVLTQPPTATGNTVTSTPGLPFSGTVATITALEPHSSPSDFSATIDWGNGSTSTGKIILEPTGVYAVNGSATYAQPGTYTIHVSITTNSSRVLSASGNASVVLPPMPPPILVSPPVAIVTPQQPTKQPDHALHLQYHHKVAHVHHWPPQHHQQHHAPAQVVLPVGSTALAHERALMELMGSRSFKHSI